MRVLLMSLLGLMCVGTAFAQDQKPSKEPIEITANQSLEWHRDAQMYIAREKAIAKQGATELHGEILTAKYTDGEGKGTTITRIDAVGAVMIISDGSHATGDKGFYDVSTGYSELTGDNLLLKTPSDTITARDKLTYDANKSEMNAYGNARAVREDDTITADRLIGRFKKDVASGESKLSEMEAIGNVVITTPTDVMKGDRGIYLANTNKATITGHVRIDRGPNIITGARGEIDMTTNISRMFGGAASATAGSEGAIPSASGSDTRVRGVFYPE